jgi:DNA-binding transcriptional LysR family regulator
MFTSKSNTLLSKGSLECFSMRYNLARFDLVSIRLVALCASTGSLSAATAQMNLALAAGSRRLGEIETAVGVPLFERTSRGLITTAGGGIFVKHALALLRTVDSLGDEMDDFRNGVKSHVSFHASTAAINQFLPELLQSFSTHFPEIKIDLFEQPSYSVVSALRDRRCDVGVFVEGPNIGGLTVAHFCSDELCLVLPRQHPMALERKAIRFAQTLHENYVGLSSGAAVLQSQQSAAIAEGKVLKLRMQVQSFDGVCHLVASGLGIAVLPINAIGALARSLNLSTRKLADDWAKRNLYVARREDSVDQSAIALMDFMSRSAVPKRSKTPV